MCWLCCCSHPDLVDSGEKARGVVPPPVLSALAARGTVGKEVKFLCQLGTCGSFLPPPTSSKKSHLARWSWIATSCLLGQQEMAESRGDSNPHLLRRAPCRDIFPVGRNLLLSAASTLTVLKMNVRKSATQKIYFPLIRLSSFLRLFDCTMFPAKSFLKKGLNSEFIRLL